MILAWSWVPAVAVGGAVLAAGPVVIHLLNRRRFKVLHWAAMRFLLESRRKNRRRLRLEELLLLALRVLICLMLGLGLANIRSDAGAAGRPAPALHVFVIDDSMSMGQQAGGETLLTRAVRHAADLIAAMPPTDRVAVLSATRPQDEDLLGKIAFAADLQAEGTGGPEPAPSRFFPRVLRSLRPNQMRARLPEAIAAAGQILAAETIAQRRLYLLSDFRRNEFADRLAAEAVGKAFARLADLGTDITIMNYCAPAPPNLTVERVELLDRAAVAGQKARFLARVRNWGDRPVAGAAITVRAGDVTFPAAPLAPIAPGDAATHEFTCTFAEAGPAAVCVTVTPDALPADNSASLALTVRDAVRVLVVEGLASPADPPAGSGFCLARALDPSGDGKFGQRCDVVAADALADARLDEYDAVILANVADLPAAPNAAGQPAYPLLASLVRYVREGGGLAIFLGDRVNLDFYNGPMFSAGLVALRLEAPSSASHDPRRFVRLRPDSIAADPMLRIFTGRGESFTGTVRFFAYVPGVEPSAADTAPADAGPVQVLARFDDRQGSPAVVRRTLGRGTVILWTSSADVRWTDWPKDLTFLPVMNDMVASLARRQDDGLDGPVGTPLRFALPRALADAAAITLTTPAWPEEEATALFARPEAGMKIVESAPTRWAGLYELRLEMPDGTPRVVYLSRRIDPAEGDLAPADRADVERAIGLPHTFLDGLATATSAATATDRPQRAWWSALLAAALAALGLETFLAQRFGHYRAPARPAAAGRSSNVA